MSKSFAEMEDMYKEVVKRFNKIELREWKAEGAMIELAKQVMIKEKYYALEGDVLNVDKCLGNEMADVIAQIMRLADYYKIDLEKAFIEAREDEDRYLKSRGV
jgi:NTP pyrophosphatase (non-canonical NTP hydrolase)